jgi:hypothetical protein
MSTTHAHSVPCARADTAPSLSPTRHCRPTQCVRGSHKNGQHIAPKVRCVVIIVFKSSLAWDTQNEHITCLFVCVSCARTVSNHTGPITKMATQRTYMYAVLSLYTYVSLFPCTGHTKRAPCAHFVCRVRTRTILNLDKPCRYKKRQRSVPKRALCCYYNIFIVYM